MSCSCCPTAMLTAAMTSPTGRRGMVAIPLTPSRNDGYSISPSAPAKAFFTLYRSRYFNTLHIGGFDKASTPRSAVSAVGNRNTEEKDKKTKKKRRSNNLLTLLLGVSSVPYSSYVPEPSYFLHEISAEVKQLWIVGAVLAMARASPTGRMCVALTIAAIAVAGLPPRLWRPQLMRVGGLCAFVFIMTAFGADGVAPVLNTRAMPADAVAVIGGTDVPSSMPSLGQRAYSYVVLNAGPFTITKRGLGLASAIAGLTFVAIQGASVALVTTPPERMALAVGHILRPFGWLGVPVRELILTVLLALRFMSTVFEEARNLCLGIASRGIDWSLVGKRGTFALALRTCGRLFSNLLNRSDKIATAMVARGFCGPTEECLSALEATAGRKAANLWLDVVAICILIGLFILSRTLL